jgi:(1->4)-alpha-D-glucan 1-alpha-D-glucosylmutase
MVKAVKEAKVHTSWINPNKAYDDAVVAFVDRTLTGPRARRFLSEFIPFQQRIARLGMLNSLSQVVLKIVSPGVPDFYQGTELWDTSLVDPDNRRPVDFAVRARLLGELETWLPESSLQNDGSESSASTASRGGSRRHFVADLLEHWPDGRIKLYITACGLRLRRRLRHVFVQGEYLPLNVFGQLADNVVALARRHGEETIIAVVPRFNSRLLGTEDRVTFNPGQWQSTGVLLPTEASDGHWRNLFTGELIPTAANGHSSSFLVADLLGVCPVALIAQVS